MHARVIYIGAAGQVASSTNLYYQRLVFMFKTLQEDDDPLNTDDDVSDDNISEDSTENVVVCLFEKVGPH